MTDGTRKDRRMAPALALLAALCGAAGVAAEGRDAGERPHRVVVVADGDDRQEVVHEVVLGAPGGGFLGVELTALSRELRVHFGVPEDAGVMVARVVEDSPAWRGGLRVGDIVTTVSGVRVDSPGDLAREVRERGGETVTLELWRDGRLEQLDVALEERDASWQGFEAFGLPCAADGDCAFDRFLHWRGLDCEREECKVVVRCDGPGQCECEVDGESRDCDELEGDGE
jgi:hypothetical protein